MPIRAWLAGVMSATGILMAAAGAHAASVGFAVSPAFEQVSLKAGEPQASYFVEFANRTRQDQTFVLSVVDFGALDESGGVAFLGTPANELEHKYGLASWMSLEKNIIFVPASTNVSVRVTIDNRQSLSTGGHYGAILATAISDPGAPSGDRVGVKQVLSSLVLVTKEGGAKSDLRLVSQTTNGQFWALPSVIEQRYQNAGNTHVVPRGTVEVRDPVGRVVRRGAINEGSNVILPESFRRYKSALGKVNSAILPGYYTLSATYRYDGTDATKTSVSGLWYAGQLVVWTVLGLSVIAVFALAWVLWRRPYRKAHKKRHI